MTDGHQTDGDAVARHGDADGRREPGEGFERPFLPPRTRPRHGGSILMAAMVGIAEALGLDPEPTEIAQPASPGSGPEFDLHFGDLPPLD